MCFSVVAVAQDTIPDPQPPKQVKKPWYESFNIRGYAQVRYNGLFETNPDLRCEQCDRSWGDGGSFFIRRIRVIFSGQISDRVYFYIQPDFASSPGSGALNFGQIRDAYFDIGLDKNNEFRFRIGQSKIPFGFENLQSSQNRLPLDRNDAINSAFSNERDLGVMFYWAPAEKRKLLSSLVRDGLKGSGDYGVVGVGIFNGQTANRADENGEPHVVGRVSYPFVIGNQIIEPGIQAYTGKYVLTSFTKSILVDGIEQKLALNANQEYLDQRVAASFVLYPKPFGIQAEYNVGKGPEFNKFTDAVEVQDLRGGYATLSYLAEVGDQVIIPFTRIQSYKGGKKHELDARSYRVKELEVGVEWQPFPTFELVAMYTFSSRRFEDFRNQENFQEGSLMRFQAQINF